jgi:hypothetical protein
MFLMQDVRVSSDWCPPFSGDHLHYPSRRQPSPAEATDDGKRLFRKDGSTVAWSRDDMFDIDRRLEEMDKKDIAVRIMSLSAPNVYLWNGADQVAAARQ